MLKTIIIRNKKHKSMKEEKKTDQLPRKMTTKLSFLNHSGKLIFIIMFNI